MKDDPAALLRRLWNAGTPEVAKQDIETIGQQHVDSIDAIINDEGIFKAFRYILPGQLLAKASNPSHHTLALQKRSTLPGAFDARSFTKDYICAFDREHERVLGGSDDPLVGNIARRPQMDAEWLAVGRRAAQGGEHLVSVLQYAQGHPKNVEALLQITLRSIAKRLARTRIIYPRPNRIALSACEQVISKFLAAHTGGRRLQALAAALFDTIGEYFSLYAAVDVGHVNKADVAKDDIADIDCRDEAGRTLLSVEVKDRQINTSAIEDTLRVARDRGVAEILFLLRGGIAPEEQEELSALQQRQFTSGHNVYHVEFESLLRPCLILFAEAGRLLLLEKIADRIDEMGELIDRQTWQHLLDQL